MVARSSQPWAERWNPVGIPVGIRNRQLGRRVARLPGAAQVAGFRLQVAGRRLSVLSGCARLRGATARQGLGGFEI